MLSIFSITSIIIALILTTITNLIITTNINTIITVRTCLHGVSAWLNVNDVLFRLNGVWATGAGRSHESKAQNPKIFATAVQTNRHLALSCNPSLLQ